MRRELALVALLAGCGRCSIREADRVPPVAAVIVRSLTVAQAVAELQPANRNVAYRAPTVEEKAALHDVIRAAWLGDEAGLRRAAAAAAGRGFALERWEVEGRPYWVVREPERDRRGAGTYVVRAGPPAAAAAVLLETPHIYFDRGTGEIGARLLFEAPDPALRGLFLNSLHRYQRPNGARVVDPASPADVCHNPDYLYGVATAAVLAAGGAVDLVVQLHGFDDDEPRARDAADPGPPGGAPRAIVSAGEARSSATSTALAAALGGPAAGILRYPEEIQRLGGTRNAQGRLCRAAGVPFVHLEMTLALRTELRSNAAARAPLRAALAAAATAAASGHGER